MSEEVGNAPDFDPSPLQEGQDPAPGFPHDPNEPVELSLDDLFNQEVDEAAVVKGLKDSALPTGTYTTEIPPSRLSVTKDKNNRLMVSGFWKVTMGDVKGAIGFRFSPERRNKIDGNTGEDTGKPDTAFKNYTQAFNAYTRVYGEKPTSVGAIATYLRDYPVKFRIVTLSSGENWVAAIMPVL